MILKFIYLFLSILVLVKSSDYFTQSAEKVGIFFKLPPFVVGVTIVSIGTSLPELVTSIFAVLDKHSAIVAGNVAGSNIANILLVLGLSSIVSKNLLTEHDIMKVDLPFLAASSFFLYLACLDGQFDYKEGILSLIAIIVYMIYAGRSRNIGIENIIMEKLSLKEPIILLLSIIFVNLSAQYTIQNIVDISNLLHISTGVVAASIVALGTSLPELMVSLNASKRGNLEMAIGNIIGSNIFNTFGIMGAASIVGNLTIDKTTLHISLPVMVAATIMIVFSLQNKAMSKWIGYTFIIFYVLYIMKLFS